MVSPQVLAAIPEQDAYFDVVDNLERQGMESIVRRYERAKTADERDLVEQLQLYDRTLRHEDDLGGVKKRLVTLILTRFFIHFSYIVATGSGVIGNNLL